MSAFRTILVATDFSESSQEAFDVALGIARDTRADVHVLYVVPDPLNLPWVVEGAGMDFIELQRTWMADARRELTQTLAARGADPAKVKATVALGTPAVEITRHAAQWKSDLLWSAATAGAQWDDCCSAASHKNCCTKRSAR